LEEVGWNCVNFPSTCNPICGDGIKRGSEACDDQNLIDNDGCSSVCVLEDGFICNVVIEPTSCVPNCGDGKVVGTEACDDGDNVDNEGCSTGCNGVLPGWSCSLGNPSTASICS